MRDKSLISEQNNDPGNTTPDHLYNPRLGRVLVKSYIELSTANPSLFPLTVKQLANHYLGKLVLRHTEKARFYRRFAETIRELETDGLIKTAKVKNESCPHLLPIKLIYVWE